MPKQNRLQSAILWNSLAFEQLFALTQECQIAPAVVRSVFSQNFLRELSVHFPLIYFDSSLENSLGALILRVHIDFLNPVLLINESDVIISHKQLKKCFKKRDIFVVSEAKIAIPLF